MNTDGTKQTVRRLGRALQAAALVCLPISMLLELTGMLGRSFGLSQMLIMMVFGILLFVTGRLVEGYALR